MSQNELAARLEAKAATEELVARCLLRSAAALHPVHDIDRVSKSAYEGEKAAQHAADLRAAAQAVRASQWRPISEAPKDEECLVGRKSWTDNAWFWDKCRWHPEAMWRDWTHYLPLPAPPEAAR